MEDLSIPPLTIPAADLTWFAVRSGGPGGQNVNKVASKVDLRFDLEGTRALRPEVKARLRRLAAGRLDKDGRVQIISSVTRDQSRNLEDARQRLAAMIRQAMIRPKHRRATKPSRGAKERRLKEKKRRSERKQSRGKVNY